jgi:RNA polymerase sigma factor (sigma-70 family)
VIHPEVTKENFDQVLSWLHHDREEAGQRYEQIRRNLIQIFNYRGYSDAEDLADETINRVTKKISDIASTYVGNPSFYFYGVARNLMKERDKKQQLRIPLSLLETQPTYVPSIDKLIQEEAYDREITALRECLEELPERERKLLFEYYSFTTNAKFGDRKKLADKLNLNVNALRVKIHRIRTHLARCIRNKIESAKHNST